MQTPTIVLSPQKTAVSAAGGHLDVLVRVQAPDLPENPIANHTPKRLSVVVDRSGSMDGEPLHEALRCVMHIAKHLTPKDQMSLVVYDEDVDVLVPLKPMAAVSDETYVSNSGVTYTQMGPTTVGTDGSVFTQMGSHSSDGSTRMGDTATGLGAVFNDDDEW